MTPTLNFDSGVAEMDLATLKRTLPYEDARGNLPRVRPVEHTALIDMVMEIIKNKTGRDAVLDTIYAGESQSMRVGHKDKDQPCPVEKFLIQRVVTRINFPFMVENELNPAVAISYSESGICVSFGTRVWICKNLSIFGQNLWTTYGSSKVPFEKGMEVLTHWMENFDDKVVQQMETIQKMKNIMVDDIVLDRITGRLIRNAVLWNNGVRENIISPLNVTQVSRMIEEGHEFFKKPENTAATLWDVANFGTAVLKPRSSDMVSILKDNQEFNNFLLETFQLN